MRAVELYAGICNFGRAARRAGVEVVAAYEIDPEAVRWAQLGVMATGEADPWHIRQADVTQLTAVPRAELVLAGIPCQPFSQILSGGRARGMADERGRPLWEATARVAQIAGADVVIVEEVDGAVKAAATEGRAIFRRYGYPFFHYHALAAADFGSCQVRRRMWATYSRFPLKWEPDPSMRTGPRPIWKFLLGPDDFRNEEEDDGLEYERLREALRPCYLGPRHMRGLIEKSVANAGSGSGYGLSAVPVTHEGPIGAFPRNYWKVGGGMPLIADRCLECGYPIDRRDSFLYLTDVDLGEDVLRFPAHVFCWDCVEALRDYGAVVPVRLSERSEAAAREALSWLRELHPDYFERLVNAPDWLRLAAPWEPFPGDLEAEQVGCVPWGWVHLPPLDLSEEGLPDVQAYLRLRLMMGATSVRRFHPREIARMFGVPDEVPLPAAPSAAARLLGNSLHVGTAEAVIRGVLAALEARRSSHAVSYAQATFDFVEVV